MAQNSQKSKQANKLLKDAIKYFNSYNTSLYQLCIVLYTIKTGNLHTLMTPPFTKIDQFFDYVGISKASAMQYINVGELLTKFNYTQQDFVNAGYSKLIDITIVWKRAKLGQSDIDFLVTQFAPNSTGKRVKEYIRRNFPSNRKPPVRSGTTIGPHNYYNKDQILIDRVLQHINDYHIPGSSQRDKVFFMFEKMEDMINNGLI